MSRTSALALAALAGLALGCARAPVTVPSAATDGAHDVTAHVNAGPPACTVVQARIERAAERQAAEAGTWLDAPNRMVEARRLRVLHARAERLGCAGPEI